MEVGIILIIVFVSDVIQITTDGLVKRGGFGFMFGGHFGITMVGVILGLLWGSFLEKCEVDVGIILIIVFVFAATHKSPTNRGPQGPSEPYLQGPLGP